MSVKFASEKQKKNQKILVEVGEQNCRTKWGTQYIEKPKEPF